MLITRETDYALRMLRVLLDEEKHSAAEMAETELIPMQFAYQILRKLSAGELVQVSRGAAAGCPATCVAFPSTTSWSSWESMMSCAPAWSRGMTAAGKANTGNATSTAS